MNRFHVYKDHIKEEREILRSVSKEITFPLSKKVIEISNNLIDYVEFSKDEEKLKKYSLTQAFGIAAPQLGQLVRMFYISVPSSYNSLEDLPDSKNSVKFLLINPKLIKYRNIKGAFGDGESCLSIDSNYPGQVIRPVIIEIRAYNLIDNKEMVIKAKGRLAIILLHELDHLNGVLYYDKINRGTEVPDYIY